MFSKLQLRLFKSSVVFGIPLNLYTQGTSMYAISTAVYHNLDQPCITATRAIMASFLWPVGVFINGIPL